MDDHITPQILARLETLQKDVQDVRKTIDKFGDALIRFAKTEERVVTLLEQNTILFGKIERLEGRMSTAESVNAKQSQSLGFFERIGWIAVTAFSGAVGVVGWMFR